MAQIKTKFIQDSAITSAKVAADAIDKTKIAADVAGSGLGQNGDGSLEVNVDNSTIEISTDSLQLKDDGVTGAKLAPAVAGAGLVQDGSGNLDIGAGSGISVSADAVAVDSTVVRTNGANAFTADQSHGGFKITNLADPTSAQDAATKAYVDAVKTGLDIKDSVRLATTAALSANTAAGSGVGKTLTADANGALSVDGVAVAVGNRILVKDETPGSDNGIYTVTATGDGSNPYILTRATDFDQAAEVTAGAFTFIEEGTTNADSGWVLTTNNTITVDTTALSFTQFSGAGQITAGTGLTKTANTIDFNTADTSLTVNADDVAVNLNTTGGLETSSGVRIKSDTVTANTIGITTTANGAGVKFDGNSFADSGSETLALAAGVAGVGLALTTGVLSVNVDNSTIEISTDTLQLKDDGVTGAKLAPAVAGAGLAQDGSGNLDVGAGDGITVNANDVAVNTTAIAGAGLENDGSNNLRINVDATNNTTKINGSNELESLKQIVEVITLSAGDITAESTTLSQTPNGNQVSVSVDGVVQLEGTDYSVSGTTLRFGDAADAGLTASDLDPTSGAAALVAGDKIQVSYMYL